MQLYTDCEQQRLHLMRKHGIDLEDNHQGDGSRTKSLDCKDFDVLAKSSHCHCRSIQLATISDPACLLLTKHGKMWHKLLQWALSFGVKSLWNADSTSQWPRRLFVDKVIHTPATGGAMALLCLNAYTGVFTRKFWSYFVSSNIQYLDIWSPFHLASCRLAEDLELEAILAFPCSAPCVTHEAVDLMQQFLCEPEDRLGSQASGSVVRPNSIIVQAMSSASPHLQASRGGDGAELIKVGLAGGRSASYSWNPTYTILVTSFLSWNRLGQYPSFFGAIPSRTS
jgi:protein-serine/threonine kinase